MSDPNAPNGLPILAHTKRGLQAIVEKPLPAETACDYLWRMAIVTPCILPLRAPLHAYMCCAQRYCTMQEKHWSVDAPAMCTIGC